MSRLVSGAMVALMVLGFLALLAFAGLDRALLALADFLRGKGQIWLLGGLAVTWGVFAAGMVFSTWTRTRLFRIMGQIAALSYMLFVVLGAATFFSKGEPDPLVVGGLELSGLCMLFFFLDLINEHFRTAPAAKQA